MRQFLLCDNGYSDCTVWHDDCWVNMESPDKADINFLVDELGIPADFIEDLRDVDERPRVDQDGEWVLAIMRIPMVERADNMPFTTVPVGVMTNNRAVVTLCFFETGMIQDFIAFSKRKQLTISRQSDFFLHILFSATFWYLAYLKRINEEVTGAEKALNFQVQNRDLINLMKVQKSLVIFNTSLQGNQVLLERLSKIFGDYDHDLYDDLQIEMKQADNTVNVYSHILEGTMEAYSSIISNNINQVMKRMTGITIILMVPTLVASFYGMNVEGLPLADMPLSFYIVVIVAAIFTVLTYLWLRHTRWF